MKASQLVPCSRLSQALRWPDTAYPSSSEASGPLVVLSAYPSSSEASGPLVVLSAGASRLGSETRETAIVPMCLVKMVSGSTGLALALVMVAVEMREVCTVLSPCHAQNRGRRTAYYCKHMACKLHKDGEYLVPINTAIRVGTGRSIADGESLHKV